MIEALFVILGVIAGLGVIFYVFAADSGWLPWPKDTRYEIEAERDGSTSHGMERWTITIRHKKTGVMHTFRESRYLDLSFQRNLGPWVRKEARKEYRNIKGPVTDVDRVVLTNRMF